MSTNYLFEFYLSNDNQSKKTFVLKKNLNGNVLGSFYIDDFYGKIYKEDLSENAIYIGKVVELVLDKKIIIEDKEGIETEILAEEIGEKIINQLLDLSSPNAVCFYLEDGSLSVAKLIVRGTYFDNQEAEDFEKDLIEKKRISIGPDDNYVTSSESVKDTKMPSKSDKMIADFYSEKPNKKQKKFAQARENSVKQ